MDKKPERPSLIRDPESDFTLEEKVAVLKLLNAYQEYPSIRGTAKDERTTRRKRKES